MLPVVTDYEFDSDESSPSVPGYSQQDYDGNYHRSTDSGARLHTLMCQCFYNFGCSSVLFTVDFPRVSLPLRDLEAALQELEEHQRRSGGGGSRDVRDLREVDLHNYRERRLRRALTVDDSRPARRWTPELPPPARHRPPPPRPVPIWLCVLLVASYIVAGTFLFTSWEGWAPLDAAYFCFITLTTIGFGDFVPAQSSAGARAGAVHSIALCSLYLLFGIALLAMSFNLVQEEVRGNVAALAARLGIIRQRDH